MTKKIWLSLLSVFAILFIWTTYANPIADPEFWWNNPDSCSKINNVEIDNYRVIVEYGKRSDSYSRDNRKREVYELKANECSKCSDWWQSKVYLLDKSIDVKDITEDNIDEKALLIWYIYDSDCSSYHNRITIHKIVKDWDNYELILSKTRNFGKIKEFPFIWLWTIIIETLLLFFMAKIFRKENQISNKKLLLFWVLPTTITLPLLWFILPLVIWDWIRYTIIWEALVAAIEAIIIKYWLNISRKRAIIASVICNLFSFLVLSFKNGESIRSLYMRLIILYILIQPIALIIMGKWLRKKDEISNKRFILIWIISSIVSVFVTLLVERCLIELMYHYHIFRNFDWVLLIPIIFIVKAFVDAFVIRFWLKVSRKETIIMTIICNLFLFVLLLAFYLIAYKFYD